MSTADDPKQDQRKQARTAFANDIKALMSTPHGRRIAHWLLAESGIHRTSFTGNSETFFREGERNLGLKFEAEITRHAFDDYLTMLKEANAK